jgi:hypothetical protein
MRARSFLHALLGWLTVAALTVMPIRATGHVVCLRGMVAAGQTCPRCHGERQPASPPCCAWVESAPTNGVHVTGPTLEPPAPQWTGLCALATTGELQVPGGFASASLHAGAGPPGIPPPQTTILRL